MLASFSLCRNKKSPARSARLAWRCIACARLAEQRCQGSTRPTRCLRARDGPCYAMLALLRSPVADWAERADDVRGCEPCSRLLRFVAASLHAHVISCSRSSTNSHIHPQQPLPCASKSAMAPCWLLTLCSLQYTFSGDCSAVQ